MPSNYDSNNNKSETQVKSLLFDFRDPKSMSPNITNWILCIKDCRAEKPLQIPLDVKQILQLTDQLQFQAKHNFN